MQRRAKRVSRKTSSIPLNPMRKYVCDMNDRNLLLFEYDFLIVNLRFYYTFRELDVFKNEKKKK